MIDADSAKKMQERGLSALAKHKGGFQFTDVFFPYTSGQIGPYYVQSGVVQCDCLDFNAAIQDMCTLLRSEGYHQSDSPIGLVISGGETRDWIFSIPCALGLGLPHVMLYKDGKTVGADIKGKKLAHVADLNNEGSSLRDDWAPTLKKNGGIIEDVFFYVDREEDGVEEIAKLGLKRHVAVPLNANAWDYLQKINVVAPEVYQQLRDRGSTREERKAWAEKMLRSEAGFVKLASLLASAKTREKGVKILDEGYPAMKAELVDRLKTEYGEGIVRFL